ncbi:MAG: terminase small subunit [Fibromonadales bacterium]|nr:terminase small subunit [Fibromonadales bacterium]
MRQISAQEVKFAEAYITTGGNAGQAAIAAGYSEKNASSAGKRIYKRARVQAKLKELREEIEAKYDYSRDKMLKELEELKEKAKSERYINFAAIMKAIEIQGKMLGLFESEKVQVSHIVGSFSELQEAIKRELENEQ